MRNAPSAPQCMPVMSDAAAISIRGPFETPLRRRSERSVPAARNSARAHGCGRHAAALPFSAAIRRSGRIGISIEPDAGRVVDRVGDRGRCRHGCDLADADAAAEHVIETRLVEMHVDHGRVGNPWNTIILHPAAQRLAGAGIDLARFIERIADALNDRARRLASRQRGCRDLADRNAGVDVETRTWPSQVSTSTSITCTELGTPAPIARLEKRRIIQPKIHADEYRPASAASRLPAPSSCCPPAARRRR